MKLYRVIPSLGRTVLLEQPNSSGAKVISHMLVSHGGMVLTS